MKKPAEDAAKGVISNSSIYMGGGTEWFYYGTSANLESMRQRVRAAIDPWIEVAGSSSDLVESSINPCLAPNQASLSFIPFLLPLIPFFFFALVPTFSTNPRGNACYAGYY